MTIGRKEGPGRWERTWQCEQTREKRDRDGLGEIGVSTFVPLFQGGRRVFCGRGLKKTPSSSPPYARPTAVGRKGEKGLIRPPLGPIRKGT
jgi:hypothetical protein